MKNKIFVVIVTILIASLACGVLTKSSGGSTPEATETYGQPTLQPSGENPGTADQSGTYLLKLYNLTEVQGIPLSSATPTPGWNYYRARITVINSTSKLLAVGGDAYPTLQFEPTDAAGDTANGAPFAGGSGAHVETDKNVNYPADFIGVQYDDVNHQNQDMQQTAGLGLVTRLIPAHYEASRWMMVSSSIFGAYQYPGWIEVFFAVPQTIRPTDLVIEGQPKLSLQNVPNWSDNHRVIDAGSAGYQTLPATIQIGDQLKATIQPLNPVSSNSTTNRGILTAQIIFSNLDQTMNQQIPSPYSTTSVFDLADSYGSITVPFASNYTLNQDCPNWPMTVGPGHQVAATICWRVGGTDSSFLVPNDPLHPFTGSGDKMSYILSVILGNYQGSFLGTTDAPK